MKTIRIIFLVIIFAAASPLLCDENADEIMRRHFARAKADSSKMNVTLMLVSQDGRKLTRSFTQYSISARDLEASYLEVSSPADIAGVRFLSLKRDGQNEQRLYLPELKKSKRIASSSSGSSGKGARFLGSDIFYYDLESRDFDDAAYKWIGMETVAAHQCHIIDAIPLDKDCPYAKSRFCVSASDAFVWRTVLYDGQGNAIKQADVVEIKTEQGIDFASRMVIKDLVKNHSTLYMLNSIEVNPRIARSIFSVQHIER